MTTRHGFSSALGLLCRLPPSAPYRRTFSVSTRHLKELEPEKDDAFSKNADYDYRRPCHAARRNFPTHIRHLMRSTPNSLTVITSSSSPQQYRDDPSAAPENEDIEPTPEVKGIGMDPLPRLGGLLVSSFNTVTLTPKPYVSFNIRLPSTTYYIIRASNGFTASGLKDARVADAFVKRRFNPADPFGHKFLSDLVESDGRLKKGTGGTWWMRCRLQGDKCVEVGDHMMLVAKVLECGGYEGGEGMGLIYANGAYCKVGESMDLDLDLKQHCC